MFDRLLEIILAQYIYSISGAVLVVLTLISLKSEEFYKGIKMILWLALLLWVGSVGYEYNTGYSVLSIFNNNTERPLGSDKDIGAFQKYMSTGARDKK